MRAFEKVAQQLEAQAKRLRELKPTDKQMRFGGSLRAKVNEIDWALDDAETAVKRASHA